MITREELRGLSAVAGAAPHFVSLYLDVSPAANTRGDYEIRYKNLLRSALDKLDKKMQRELQADFDAIQTVLSQGKRQLQKGLALLSCQAQDLLRVYHFSVPVADDLVIDAKPYLKPMLDLLDNYRRYAVVLVDRESARIFLVHLGEIEEYTDLFSEVPGQHKKGGWAALSQTRFKRYIEQQVRVHLEEVIELLDEALLGREEIDRILVGGPTRAVARFGEMLPPALQSRVVGRFAAEMTAGVQEVLQQSLSIMNQVERQDEEELLQALEDQVRQGDLGVIGLDDTIASVQQGRVRTLVLQAGFKAAGSRCTACGSLMTGNPGICRYCNQPVESVPYLVELISQQALAQGAQVEVIRHSARLQPMGMIGAFLRY